MIFRSMNEPEGRHLGWIPFVHDLSADYALSDIVSQWKVANTSQHKGLRNGGKRNSGLRGLRLLEASARLRTQNSLCALKKLNSRRHGPLFARSRKDQPQPLHPPPTETAALLYLYCGKRPGRRAAANKDEARGAVARQLS